jgi:hypothetical protein
MYTNVISYIEYSTVYTRFNIIIMSKRDREDYEYDVRRAVSGGGRRRMSPLSDQDREAAAERMHALTTQMHGMAREAQLQQNNMQHIIAANHRLQNDNQRYMGLNMTLSQETTMLKSTIANLKSQQSAELGYCQESLGFAERAQANAERDRAALIAFIVGHNYMPMNHIETFLQSHRQQLQLEAEKYDDDSMGAGSQYKPPGLVF